MTDRQGPDPDRKTDIALDTPRLRIELPVLEDAPGLYELVGGDDRLAICQFLIWDGPDSIEDVQTWIERHHNQSYGEGGFHWVIRDATGDISGSSGRPLGSIGTRPLRSPGRADVGYWLGGAYWGRGIMSEALRAVMDLGFNELRYHKIEAEVYSHNARGRSLVESMGMTQEGVTRPGQFKNGEWVDTVHYGVLHDEWEPSRP